MRKIFCAASSGRWRRLSCSTAMVSSTEISDETTFLSTSKDGHFRWIDFDYDFYLPETAFRPRPDRPWQYSAVYPRSEKLSAGRYSAQSRAGRRKFLQPWIATISLFCPETGVFNLKKIYPSCRNVSTIFSSISVSAQASCTTRSPSFTMIWQQVFSRSMVDGFNRADVSTNHLCVAILSFSFACLQYQ